MNYSGGVSTKDSERRIVMLKKPRIEGKYLNDIIEIRYFGADDEIGQDEIDEIDNITTNNGYVFKVLRTDRTDIDEDSLLKVIEKPKVDVIEDHMFEVVGWVNRAPDFPYDFLLRDLQTEKHFAATLHGRSDGWPLFAIQNEKPTCSRSRMGSDWNCRMCVKYFGTTCKAW